LKTKSPRTTPQQTSKPPRKDAKRARLDVLVATHAATSRQRAQALILGGSVTVNGETQRKPGALVAPDARIELAKSARFVGRGGAKLEKALDAFGWLVEDVHCLDVGASTGGFTDCLLQRGAASVVALDVGYGHLAWSLRTDARVTVVERTNFRYADLSRLGAPFSFACVDVSFISLTKLAVQFANALAPGGRLIALVKPQFEAGRAAVERGGVVRSERSHEAAITSVIASFEAAGLQCEHLTYSPITGPAGNIEFLVGAVRMSQASVRDRTDRLDVAGVVRRAHEALER
jgi:23S rRNA (cytidine1920-2'-O)/16S rRNA (cytidine1409-2'-O)-methyltransferase